MGPAVHRDGSRRQLFVAFGVQGLPRLGGPGLVVVRHNDGAAVLGVRHHKGPDKELGRGPRGHPFAVPGAEQPPAQQNKYG